MWQWTKKTEARNNNKKSNIFPFYFYVPHNFYPLKSILILCATAKQRKPQIFILINDFTTFCQTSSSWPSATHQKLIYVLHTVAAAAAVELKHHNGLDRGELGFCFHVCFSFLCFAFSVGWKKTFFDILTSENSSGWNGRTTLSNGNGNMLWKFEIWFMDVGFSVSIFFFLDETVEKEKPIANSRDKMHFKGFNWTKCNKPPTVRAGVVIKQRSILSMRSHIPVGNRTIRWGNKLENTVPWANTHAHTNTNKCARHRERKCQKSNRPNGSVQFRCRTAAKVLVCFGTKSQAIIALAVLATFAHTRVFLLIPILRL